MSSVKCPKCNNNSNLYLRGTTDDFHYYDCFKNHKFLRQQDQYIQIATFPTNMTFVSDSWQKEEPKIIDTYSSLEDDRDELKRLLIKLDDVCNEISVIEEKHQLHLFYNLSQELRGYRHGDIDVSKLLKENVDTKLWEIVFANSGLDRLVTATEAAKLKEKYLKDPPVYTANAARELTQNVADNSGSLVHATLHKIFETITNVDFYAGNTRMSPKQMKNGRKIEQKFRFSWWSCIPEYWIDDKHYAVFRDLEMGCAIVSEKPIPVYPNRISDKMSQDLRRGIQDYQNDFFKVKIFKNGNACIEILDKDVVDKLNRWGSKGNVLPPPL